MVPNSLETAGVQLVKVNKFLIFFMFNTFFMKGLITIHRNLKWDQKYVHFMNLVQCQNRLMLTNGFCFVAGVVSTCSDTNKGNTSSNVVASGSAEHFPS